MHTGSSYAERGAVELDQIRLTDIESIMKSFSEDDNETSSSIKAGNFWRAVFQKFQKCTGPDSQLATRNTMRFHTLLTQLCGFILCAK
jgi:hypothetical protein